MIEFGDFNVVPATFEERVSWALDHRRICVFEDQEEVNAIVLPIDKGFDRDIVKILQKKYEEDHKVKKVEMVRKRIAEKGKQKEVEKRKEKEKTDEEWLEEFKRWFPDGFIDQVSTILRIFAFPN